MRWYHHAQNHEIFVLASEMVSKLFFFFVSLSWYRQEQNDNILILVSEMLIETHRRPKEIDAATLACAHSMRLLEK